MHCVDLGESFQTHINLQNLASIQPRTSPPEFAGGRRVQRVQGGRAREVRVPAGAPQRRGPRGAPRVARPLRARAYAFSNSTLEGFFRTANVFSNFFEVLSNVSKTIF